VQSVLESKDVFAKFMTRWTYILVKDSRVNK